MAYWLRSGYLVLALEIFYIEVTKKFTLVNLVYSVHNSRQAVTTISTFDYIYKVTTKNHKFR